VLLLLSFRRALTCVYFLSFLFFFFLFFTFESDRCALVLLRVLCFFIYKRGCAFSFAERENEREREREREQREVKKM